MGDAERRIRVLPDQLANLIAAGEVVERPSAVVKELVENALDAGASSVSVEMIAGGRRLVQVSDDGTGMGADDAVMALERHATSKVAERDDLLDIASYGFRGEALPSIAAVSRLQLQTCSDDGGVGSEVAIDGGQLRSVKDVARARGTTVAVRDLFYNTPARRKFLRTDATELRHATRALTGLALGSPQLGFKLTHGARQLMECRAANSWQERVRNLFGPEMELRGVAADEQLAGSRIYGLLGRPGDAGGGFSEQYLIVNGRAIQSRALRRAIMDGYESTIESGKLPFFILFLDLDPAEVDVNVHPQKREVRFRDERAMYRFVMESVRQSFAGQGLPPAAAKPSTLPIAERRPDGAPAQPAGVPHFWRDAERAVAGRIADGKGTYRAEPGRNRSAEAPMPAEGSGNAEEPDQPSQMSLHLVSRADEEKGTVIAGGPDLSEAGSGLWQFQQRYIFVSTQDGLWIIDQHVAHERILYEETMSAMAGEPPASQRLLLPLTLELSPEQNSTFEEIEPILESMGFGVQKLSGRSIIVDAYPGSAECWDDGQLLRRLVDDIAESGTDRTGIKERMATSYSCHAAIKAGDMLDSRKMHWLIERLFASSMPYVCPHGRPTIVKIAVEEFDHRFGRT